MKFRMKYKIFKIATFLFLLIGVVNSHAQHIDLKSEISEPYLNKSYFENTRNADTIIKLDSVFMRKESKSFIVGSVSMDTSIFKNKLLTYKASRTITIVPSYNPGKLVENITYAQDTVTVCSTKWKDVGIKETNCIQYCYYKNKLTTKIALQPDGTRAYLLRYNYDEEGNLIEILSEDVNSTKVRTKIKYASNNLYPPNILLINSSFRLKYATATEVEIISYPGSSSKSSQVIDYYFDEQGNEIYRSQIIDLELSKSRKGTNYEMSYFIQPINIQQSKSSYYLNGELKHTIDLNSGFNNDELSYTLNILNEKKLNAFITTYEFSFLNLDKYHIRHQKNTKVKGLPKLYKKDFLPFSLTKIELKKLSFSLYKITKSYLIYN